MTMTALIAALGTPKEVATHDLVEAAACLWEAVLDRKNSNEMAQPDLDAAFREHGWSSIRNAVCGWARWVHLDWERAVAEHGYDDPFDWEFCPKWLDLNATFDENGATLTNGIRRLPKMAGPADPLDQLDPALRPMLIEQMGLTAEMVGGGAYILSHRFATDWTVSVTCTDGGGLPTAKNWQVGVYRPDNDGVPSYGWRSDDVFARLNLSQAIGAAWAMGTDA